MILLKLDFLSKKPLFKQVFDQLKAMIDNGVLKVGEKLPATRTFSEKIGVSRSTIFKAYEELWALGYIESKQGSYSYVRKRKAIKSDIVEKKSSINWNKRFTDHVKSFIHSNKDFYNKIKDKEQIDFVPLAPDPELSPVDDFRKCISRVMKKGGSKLLQYGEHLGHEPLRKLIVEHMQKHSINVRYEEIIITQGTQNSLELLIKLFVKPETKILVESPTYSKFIELLRYYDCKTVDIPMLKDGLDLNYLEKILKQESPAFLYSMPNFHNPTGISTSQIHRDKLLEICKKNNLILIEDGFEEELKYFGKAVLPIKSIDINNHVIYLGTFSKILFPGIRVGWIVADKVIIDAIRRIKLTADNTGNDLIQAALHDYISSGLYEMHIKRIHKVYRKRMHTAMKAVKEYFPEEISYTKPIGGYIFWIEIKKGSISEPIEEMLYNYGVKVFPGKYSYTDNNEYLSFRISIAHRNENEIEEGIKRIGLALKDIVREG